jgi:hypothetical protein
MDQINHYLKLVVEVLLEFWDPGVFFSRTYNWLSGRHFQAMLIPLVADMLGACQAIGLPGSTMAHHFCTVCDLDYHDIDVLDPTEWPAKNVEHMHYFAMLWKEAESETHQKDIFDASGLQWSALLDLPYWDPVHYTVIDSMHALDLGLLRTHCIEIFRNSSTHVGGDGTSMKPPAVKERKKPTLKELNKCLEVIRKNETNMALELSSFTHEALFQICTDYDI